MQPGAAAQTGEGRKRRPFSSGQTGTRDLARRLQSAPSTVPSPRTDESDAPLMDATIGTRFQTADRTQRDRFCALAMAIDKRRSV